MKHTIIRTLPLLLIFFVAINGSAQEPASAEPKKEMTKRHEEVNVVNGERVKELPDTAFVTWKEAKNLGERLFEIGSIYYALRYYEAALDKNPAETGLNQQLAEGHFALRDYKSANKYYKALVDLDGEKHQDLFALYQLALTYKYLGNYEAAKQNFVAFNGYATGSTDLDKQRAQARREELGCDLGIKLKADKSFREIKINLLDTGINQPFTDYAPILMNDQTLVFSAWTSDSVAMTGKREKYSTFSKIFSSHRLGKTNRWSKAEPISGVLNTVDYHVGNTTFTNDGKTMYYTQCLQDDNQRMRCQIYKSSLSDSGWLAGKKLEGNINLDGATNTEPFLGKNELGEEVLYFASDRNTNRGMDLFYVTLNPNGSVSKAKEVPGINTRGDELTPYYDLQTNTLYFSSNGYINIGGYDVFKTTATSGKWSEPENLGMPVNSSADDMYFNWDQQRVIGFVVSNRPGGYGLKSETCCDDIYQLSPNNLFLAVKGTLLNADTADGAITNQLVSLYDATSGALLKTYNSTNGTYFFDLEKDKSYKISAVKEGYFAAVQTFNTIRHYTNDTMNFNLRMEKMEKDKTYTLNNIYYEFDKSNLTKASKSVLDTLYNILRDNPKIVIELSAHTDAKGADKYNMELSQKRAESCMKYLTKDKGIAKERITARGYGETVPIAPNTKPDGTDDEEGRAKNRRTAFKIIN